MPTFSLLNYQFAPELGGFTAIVMVESGASRRRVDCFFEASQSTSDRQVIKGLLAHAKEQSQNLDFDQSQGFPLSPNQVRYMRSA